MTERPPCRRKPLPYGADDAVPPWPGGLPLSQVGWLAHALRPDAAASEGEQTMPRVTLSAEGRRELEQELR
jgi:hypothetical protein